MKKNLLLIQYFFITIVLLSEVSTYAQQPYYSSLPNVVPGTSYPGFYIPELSNDRPNNDVNRVVGVPQFGDNNNFAGGDDRLRNGPQIFFPPPPPPPSSSYQDQPGQEFYNHPSGDDGNYNNYGNNYESTGDGNVDQTTINNDGGDNLYELKGDESLVSKFGNDLGQNSTNDYIDVTNVDNNNVTYVDTSNGTTTS